MDDIAAFKVIHHGREGLALAVIAKEIGETGLEHGQLSSLEALDQGGVCVVTNSFKAAACYCGCRNKPEMGHARKAGDRCTHAPVLAIATASLPMRLSAWCSQMSSERSVRAPLVHSLLK